MKEWETINSMVPIWQRPKSQVTKEEYNDFYKSKFGDWQDPILSIHVAAEGNFEYKALLYVPGQVPMNYFSTDFKKGLQLYSSGVHDHGQVRLTCCPITSALSRALWTPRMSP